MHKQILKSTLLAAILGLASLSANATVVDFSFSNISDIYTGSFAGIDINGDNLLTLDELTSFSFSYVASPDVTGLSDFGSFNIANNVWNADASGWNLTNFAYFSWDNGNLSANTTNVFNMVTTIAVSEVPEPASVALLALGALGLVAARRRQQ